jgi:hypothetical protein
LKFQIDRVIRQGTRNAVVELDNGSILKVNIEDARAGAYLEFEGELDKNLQVIPKESFRPVQQGDMIPEMLESLLY